MPVLNVDIAETIEITSNGLHDVAKYTTADVNVPKVINPLPITPSTSAQTFTATGGVDGYSPVSVSAVTSSIDANITAGNIKDGVTILGVTGNYTGGTPVLCLQYRMDDKLHAIMQPDVFLDLGTATDVANYGFYGAFNSNNSITTADMSQITDVTGDHGCASMFYQASNFSSINLSNLQYVGVYGCTDMLGQTAITSLDLHSLTTVDEWGLGSVCAFCTNLTSVNLNSLTSLGSYALAGAFGQTALTSLSFPALTSNSFNGNTDCFEWMLDSVDGCTVHFPSNLQSVIGSWSSVQNGFSGTNTTVLFDLPATA